LATRSVACGGELRCGAATLVATSNLASPNLIFFGFFIPAGKILGISGLAAGISGIAPRRVRHPISTRMLLAMAEFRLEGALMRKPRAC
jgi:hypothetical protein